VSGFSAHTVQAADRRGKRYKWRDAHPAEPAGLDRNSFIFHRFKRFLCFVYFLCFIVAFFQLRMILFQIIFERQGGRVLQSKPEHAVASRR
jgi:hypothetical protein